MNERKVFDDIEFFIPQLAHMSIHLSDTVVSGLLKKLNALICLASPHLALQLSYIYLSALEDFQPELSNGVKNPNGNMHLFTTCSNFLQEVEKTFVYGGSTVDVMNGNELSSNTSSKKMNNTASNMNADVGITLQGSLMYKREIRKSFFLPKPWKVRYFRIQNRILFCYRDTAFTELLRAIPLQDCDVITSKSNTTDTVNKYEYYFEVINKTISEKPLKFILRTDTKESFELWKNALIWYAHA